MAKQIATKLPRQIGQRQGSTFDQNTARQTCSNCSVGDLCLALGLEDSALEKMDAMLRVRHSIAPDDHVVRKNDRFYGLYAVKTGCFKSYVVDRDGREHVKAFHLPGELMGLEGISAGHYVANVVALNAGAVCDLRYEQLLSVSAEEPCLQAQLLNLFARNIAEQTRRIGDYTSDEKMAAFLLDISRRYAERGRPADSFDLFMPRRDIANYLGLATETVSRVLTRFQKRKLLHVNRKRVTLLDTTRLEEIAAALMESR